jgi:flagellar motor switch protein FliN/FliY
MSTDQTAEGADQDALADEWAAALAEQVPEAPAAAGTQIAQTDRAEDASHLFPRLGGAGSTQIGAPRQDIDMILDIPVQLTVELGRTRIPIKHILQLAQGSVVELDALAGEPMDVLVNGCLIAQGEVVVVNDKFGIRLTDIVTPSERVRRLNRT